LSDRRFSPRAIILDMDGLMVDSEPLWFRVEHAFAAERGGDWTHTDARSVVGRGIPVTLEVMNKLFGFPVEQERDTAAIMDAFIGRVAELRLKPGCMELLDAASGKLPLAVASSSPDRLIRAVMNRFDLLPRFGAVVSGESVVAGKPEPDIFLSAAKALGVAPGHCVVLEDSIAGATAGRAAGMNVIAVPEGPWEGRGYERVSDVIVSSLHEARAHIVIG
jgi:sugar-phosphatase